MANIQVGNGVDAAVVVPASIRAGAARADELIARAQAETRGEAPPGEQQQPPPQPQPTGKDALPQAPVPLAPPQQPQEPAPPQEQQPPQPTAADWEQRYRAMKGRYDATVQHVQSMQADFQRQIDELRRAPATPPPAPQQLAKFDEEDDATWGPDFRMAVQRRVDAAMTQVRQELTGQIQQVGQVAQLGTEEALRAELTRLLPAWEDINFDPQFSAWLALPDEMSGVRRQDLVNKAYNERNAQRVVKFFNRFLSEAAPAPAEGQAPAPLPAPNGNTPPASQRLSLTELAAPGPARPAASANTPATPTVKRFWKNSEIGEFFRAKHRGAYDGTPENRALAAAYEADIFAAQAEGRVAQG